MKTYRADWVIPVERPPIRDGIVSVDNQLIVEVDRYRPGHAYENLIDLGNGAIIPGLVNAHTHLEFSHLNHPIGQPGMPFTDWIREIIKTRIESANEDKPAAIQSGLAESFAAGVGCLGEIASDPVEDRHYGPDSPALSTPISKVVFFERLGRDKNQFQQRLAELDDFLNLPATDHWSPAISPHAPYSVHRELMKSLCQRANPQTPVAMHIAETEAERELLEQQTGPFVELLQNLGVWDPATFLPPWSIMDVLETLAIADRSLVIHGNYLREPEIKFIADHREQMSVVYCPRTHHYFRHDRYPLDQFLKAGICVAVGTDSRASNPDLDLFEELTFIAVAHPQLSPEKILEMGTLSGAIALGQQSRLGSLKSGKQAILSFVTSETAAESTRDHFNQWLVSPSAKCKRIR